MPRARVPQVTPESFAALLDRVEKLEASISEKKRGKNAKEDQNDSNK